MLNKLLSLSRQIDQLKNCAEIESDFNKLLIELRTLKDEDTSSFSDRNVNDAALLAQIASLIDYQTYDQLGVISQIFIRYFAGSRPGAGTYKSWNKRGKFLYDIHSIEIRLNAIIFKLENKWHSA